MVSVTTEHDRVIGTQQRGWAEGPQAAGGHAANIVRSLVTGNMKGRVRRQLRSR
jgi:hypothetical protein